MKITVWFGVVLGALSAAGKVIVTRPGESATLKCGANAYLKRLEWRHENNRIYNADEFLLVPRRGQGSTAERSQLKNTDLRITQVKEEDAGKFTCEVDGSSQEHTLLVVSVSVSSSADLRLGDEATLQCRVKGLNPDSTVQWKRPDGSPHTGSHTVQLKSLARSDVGTWNCTFSHAGVTYGESLNIKVTEPLHTTPAPGPSRNSKDVRPTPPSDTDLLLGLSWWMWLVIAVGCVVVLFLVVFVIYLYRRIKRRKIELRKMKNVRQRLTAEQYCQCNRPTAAAKPQQGRRREKPSAPPLQPLLMG